MLVLKLVVKERVVGRVKKVYDTGARSIPESAGLTISEDGKDRLGAICAVLNPVVVQSVIEKQLRHI